METSAPVTVTFLPWRGCDGFLQQYPCTLLILCWLKLLLGREERIPRMQGIRDEEHLWTRVIKHSD